MLTALILWILKKWHGDAFHPACMGRAPGWASLSKRWLREHPRCARCNRLDHANVPHHKKPVHLWPELELDEGNLITLCPECHLREGHLMDWQSYNPTVEEDCARGLQKILCRPYRKDE